jgi:hypothetical protein
MFLDEGASLGPKGMKTHVNEFNTAIWSSYTLVVRFRNDSLVLNEWGSYSYFKDLQV